MHGIEGQEDLLEKRRWGVNRGSKRGAAPRWNDMLIMCRIFQDSGLACLSRGAQDCLYMVRSLH